MTDGWEPPSEAECQACWDGLKAKLAAAEKSKAEWMIEWEGMNAAATNMLINSTHEVVVKERKRIAELETERAALLAEVKRLTDTFRRLHKMDMEAEGKVSDVASEIWTEMMQIIAENGDKPSGDATSILSQRAEDGKGGQEIQREPEGNELRAPAQDSGELPQPTTAPAPEAPEGKVISSCNPLPSKCTDCKSGFCYNTKCYYYLSSGRE